MTETGERVADRRDGDLRVEFRRILFAHAEREVIGSQVISDANTHRGQILLRSRRNFDSGTDRAARVRIAIDFALEIAQQQVIAVTPNH